jgi:aspartyl-tRNA(Asn)/glutamyl-tRNA(Gln) amidotransferase subunit A
MDDTAVVGPLTRTVEDAALHMDVTVGVHPLDPNSLPHPGLSYREVLSRLPAGLRIGYSPDLGYAVVQSDVAEVVGEAVQVFEQLGHHLELVKGGPPEPGRDWGLIGVFQLLGRLADFLPDREQEFGRAFIQNVKLGVEMTPLRFAQFRRRREELNRWCADFFERYDLLLTPTVPYDPPAAKGPLLAEVEGARSRRPTSAASRCPSTSPGIPAATVRAGSRRRGCRWASRSSARAIATTWCSRRRWAFEQARPWAHDWPLTARTPSFQPIFLPSA